MTLFTVLVSRPYPSVPPPLVGLPRHFQLRVVVVDGTQATRTPGWLRNQVSVISGGVSLYMIVPVPLLTECRPLLTKHGIYYMAGRPWSPSFPRCSGGPLGKRGPSGRRMRPDGRRFLVMRPVHHWRRINSKYWIDRGNKLNTIAKFLNTVSACEYTMYTYIANVMVFS